MCFGWLTTVLIYFRRVTRSCSYTNGRRASRWALSYFFPAQSRNGALIWRIVDDWNTTDDNTTQESSEPQVSQPEKSEDDGGGGASKGESAAATPEMESSATNSQEEEEEEEEVKPKRRLISEGDKKKEHVNIVFIGHVGKTLKSSTLLVDLLGLQQTENKRKNAVCQLMLF